MWYNVGMKEGRPTKYKEEYIKKVDEYLNDPNEVGEVWEEFHKTRGVKSDTFERYLKLKLPKIESFSLYIDTPLRTLYEWEKVHPMFSQALDKIRRKQHDMLVEGSLSGKYAQGTANLMLSSNHGYAEKTISENKNTDELSDETINKLKDVFSKD
jgi:ribosomal protein S13